MSVNKVILIGNLGAKPEVRTLPNSGRIVANFSMATKERFTDRNGTKQERTEWHRVVAFGQLADACERFLRKCCNFENRDGEHPERNWAARSQAARSNSWSMK